jgi:hypothetical protein
METYIRRVKILTAVVVVAGTVLLTWGYFSNEHPLVKDIGLPVVEERSESNWNASRRVLVYSKAPADHMVYDLICEKAKAMYGGDHFVAGVDLKEIPRPMLIDGKYTKNPQRAFQIESRDFRSVLWVTEYENYVAVFFADARI